MEDDAADREFGLYLFGYPRIEKHGKPINVGWRKAVALLSYLCLAEGQLSREALATMFWPEHGHTRAHGKTKPQQS